MKPTINLDDVPLERHIHGETFEARNGGIAKLIGGKQLGYSLVVVPPGKRAFPYHCHHVNEEMFLILEGRGVVRIGGEEHPIRKGDVIATPAGGRETAHQIINTSDEELRYLCVSTMSSTEVLEYPDSQKVGVYVGSPPGGNRADRSFHFRGWPGREEQGYWDGE